MKGLLLLFCLAVVAVHLVQPQPCIRSMGKLSKKEGNARLGAQKNLRDVQDKKKLEQLKKKQKEEEKERQRREKEKIQWEKEKHRREKEKFKWEKEKQKEQTKLMKEKMKHEKEQMKHQRELAKIQNSGKSRASPVVSNSNVQNIVKNNYITVISNAEHNNNINNINSYQGLSGQLALATNQQNVGSQSSATTGTSGVEEAIQKAQALKAKYGVQDEYGSAAQGGSGVGTAAIQGGLGAAAYAEAVKASTSTKETYKKVEESSRETNSQYQASRIGAAGTNVVGGANVAAIS